MRNMSIGTPEEARELTLRAAQWLELILFRSHDAAPCFAPNVNVYEHMMDPEATDKTKLAACDTMLRSVLRRLEVEKLQGEADYKNRRPIDPFGLTWRMTQHGAVLTAIAELLSAAIAIYEQQ